jgi:alpha-L-rhamnosidase
MGGPIFGASGKINVAYFDALKAMASMCICAKLKDGYSARAERLRTSIVSHLWNNESGIMRMSDIASPTGICQDINAYAITTGISPFHPKTDSVLAVSNDGKLPLAFQGIERWDEEKVVSPYASGFAAEALFERNNGVAAVDLIDCVWGIMADPTNKNYSGGHWEAMKQDGTPIHDDTSLMHGWSTWPVYLLPRYLAGLEPIEPGWSRWKCKPVLAGLQSVQMDLSTPAGEIKVSLRVEELQGAGEIILTIPPESVAEVVAPKGWLIVTSEKIDDARVSERQSFVGKGESVIVRIIKAHEKTVQNNARPSDKDHLVTTAEEIEKLPVGGSSSSERQCLWLKLSRFLNQIIRWIF